MPGSYLDVYSYHGSEFTFPAFNNAMKYPSFMFKPDDLLTEESPADEQALPPPPLPTMTGDPWGSWTPIYCHATFNLVQVVVGTYLYLCRTDY
jgi:hypothetical protein